MNCNVMRSSKGDLTGFVCTSGTPRRCATDGCFKPSVRMCDHKDEDSMRTCDAPMCEKHAHRISPNKNLCQFHWLNWMEDSE